MGDEIYTLRIFSAGSALKKLNAKDAMSFAKDAKKEQLLIAGSADFLCGLCVKKVKRKERYVFRKGHEEISIFCASLRERC